MENLKKSGEINNKLRKIYPNNNEILRTQTGSLGANYLLLKSVL